jgi:hypothetical protein
MKWRKGSQREELRVLHDYWDGWLKNQRFPQLLEVNLGSWSGLSVRKMAEEAECVDFYNHVYQPFSAAVHSNWAHVSEKNTVECQNPTHRQHRIAAVVDLDPDPFWMYLGAKYLRKTFGLFDSLAGISPSSPDAYDQLYSDLYDSVSE